MNQLTADIGQAKLRGRPELYKPVGYAVHLPQHTIESKMTKRNAAAHIGQVIATKQNGKVYIGKVESVAEKLGLDGRECIVFGMQYEKQHDEDEETDGEDFTWEMLCEGVRLYKEYRRIVERGHTVDIEE